MDRLRAHRRLTTWIATLAVLLAALAPTVSFALGGKLGASWVEVCTVAGSKWVNAGEGEPAAPSAGHVFEHCPFCSAHTPALGMPPAPPAQVPIVDAADFVPLAFLAAPRTLHAWASAQPRAPPSRS